MNQNAFIVLGLPLSFEIDRKLLQRRYIRAVATHHPDRATDMQSRSKAEHMSAQINHAHRTLLDDETRANHLLLLLGGAAKEDDTSLPGGFLMEMLEVREEMEAAMESNNEEEHQRWKEWAAQRRTDYITQIATLFSKLGVGDCETTGDGDGEVVDTEVAGAIRTLLNAWRYIERMIEQLTPTI